MYLVLHIFASGSESHSKSVSRSLHTAKIIIWTWKEEQQYTNRLPFKQFGSIKYDMRACAVRPISLAKPVVRSSLWMIFFFSRWYHFQFWGILMHKLKLDRLILRCAGSSDEKRKRKTAIIFNYSSIFITSNLFSLKPIGWRDAFQTIRVQHLGNMLSLFTISHINLGGLRVWRSCIQ